MHHQKTSRQVKHEAQTIQSRGESAAVAIRDLFAHVIRKGTADKTRGAIIEAIREMEKHRRMGRLSNNGVEIAKQFKMACQQLVVGKLKLHQFDKIDPSQDNQDTDPTNESAFASESESLKKRVLEMRELCSSLADRIMTLWERFHRQLQCDQRAEEGIQDVFERCLQHIPQKSRGTLRLSTYEKIKGLDIEKRIKALSALIHHMTASIPSIREQEVDRLMHNAQKHASHNRLTEALEILNQLFKFNKQHLEGHRLRARIFHQLNNRFAQLCELRMIAELKEAEGQDFFTLAELQRENGQEEEAYENYMKAAMKEPTQLYLEAWGDSASRLGFWTFAVTAYRKFLTIQSNNIRAYHKLGRALFENNQPDAAYPILRRAVSLRDNCAVSQVCLGRIYHERRQSDMAELALKRAIVLDADDEDAHYWRSLILLDRSEFNEAWQAAESAYRLSANRPRNQLLAARCLDALGKT